MIVVLIEVEDKINIFLSYFFEEVRKRKDLFMNNGMEIRYCNEGGMFKVEDWGINMDSFCICSYSRVFVDCL